MWKERERQGVSRGDGQDRISLACHLLGFNSSTIQIAQWPLDQCMKMIARLAQRGPAFALSEQRCSHPIFQRPDPLSEPGLCDVSSICYAREVTLFRER